jgi:hypothetical protein
VDKESCLVAYKLCAIFNSFLVYKNLHPDLKLKYEAFLMNVAKDWATDKMEAAETESDTDLVRPGPSTRTQRMSRVDPLSDFRVIRRNMSLQKL